VKKYQEWKKAALHFEFSVTEKFGIFLDKPYNKYHGQSKRYN